MVAPAIMIFRNAVSIDKATISTNITPALTIGAGPETSGSYDRRGPEVPCEPKTPSATLSDNDIIQCVIIWYLSNPLDTARLSFNKSKFFWSPWSGPEATGTMARNPWLIISPSHQLAIGSRDARDFVFGPVGVAVSYGWIIGQVVLLFVGFRSLRKVGVDEKFFAYILLVPIMLSWLISIGTIGDHRFRVPTMTMSLILQLSALLTIRKKINDKVG